MDRPPATAEISPAELALLLEDGAAYQVLDVRAAHRLASGTVDLGPAERFINLPGSALLALADPAAAGLDRELPVAVICGHGQSSLVATAFLRQHGFDAQSMTGGMAAWMQLLLPRQLAAPAGFDALVQFDRVGKGALCYLLVSDGEALVIDVPRSTGALETAAAELGARIVAIADTHAHADYLSGGPELARRLGVPYYLNPADAVSPYDDSPARLAYTPLTDGLELAIGNGRVVVKSTPGHTLGSVTLVAGGSAAFTGDFLFMDSVGRPDLAGRSAEWAPLLYASINRARQEWPDTSQIFPAHYALDRERNGDRSIWRTLRTLKTSNAPLGSADEAQFVAWVAANVTAPPPSYRQIKTINLGLESIAGPAADELESGKNECAVG